VTLSRWWFRITLVLGVCLLVGIAVVLVSSDDGGDSVTGEEPRSELEAAKNICAAGRPDGVTYITLGDEGSSLTLIGEGEESSGASIYDIVCVLAELDMPDSVASQIERTTAMMGVQQAAWGDFEASWSYHPDNGLNMIVEQVP
jgi:hypothetical protein